MTMAVNIIICLAVILGVVPRAVLGSDVPCTSASGTCQEDNIHCSGSYVSGLCSGHASRRCCMPSGSGGCSNVNIISRSQWGARNPKHVTAMHVPVHEFFIHHTESPSCSSQSECSARVRGIQNYHMDSRGWSDIGYSFLVGEDGNVYEGRGWTHVGAHTAGYNSKAFAASMIGSYMSHLPNSKALAAVKNLIACGVHLGKISADYRLYGHRDAGQTDCPGDSLYHEIQTWPHYSHTHP
ncbi:peptidoglycan-recognition protein SC2-like [Ruditapes philippinarum]|uniref:peptidoglycan-recognition protein SC2-like n=1 Tax=Ruditapes philippinarum TaxID=129788 RepID=UPI00295B22EE|nr:peptidoglycan-recognition protein SC2-like [Ruditapes philippinarum]